MVAIACEEKGRGIGRIRLGGIDNASGACLHSFIEEAIQSGSVVHTDGWEGYGGLETKGYRQQVTVVQRSKQSATELLPRVHLVASLLKRWLLGTHQGAVSSEHLAYYLDEFTFRFNRRKSRSRGKLFYRLLQQAVAGRALKTRGTLWVPCTLKGCLNLYSAQRQLLMTAPQAIEKRASNSDFNWW